MSSPKGFKGIYKPVPPGGFCGIDPGQSSGGIAYVTENFAIAWKMPDTEANIWELLSRVARVAKLTVLERVGARPGQGASGTFKFGKNYGELMMAVTAVGARREFPTPSYWQGKMRCRTGGDKTITLRRAQELWPQLKITHAKADALLLAEYGRMFGNYLRPDL